MKKSCRKCKVVQPEKDFYGRGRICKTCRSKECLNMYKKRQDFFTLFVGEYDHNTTYVY